MAQMVSFKRLNTHLSNGIWTGKWRCVMIVLYSIPCAGKESDPVERIRVESIRNWVYVDRRIRTFLWVPHIFASEWNWARYIHHNGGMYTSLCKSTYRACRDNDKVNSYDNGLVRKLENAPFRPLYFRFNCLSTSLPVYPWCFTKDGSVEKRAPRILVCRQSHWKRKEQTIQMRYKSLETDVYWASSESVSQAGLVQQSPPWELTPRLGGRTYLHMSHTHIRVHV